MKARQLTGFVLIGIGLAILVLMLTRTYDPVPLVQRLSAKAGPSVANTIKTLQPLRVVYGLFIILPIGIGALLLALSAGKSKKTVPSTPAEAEAPQPEVLKAARKPAKAAAIHSCNVLQVGAEGRKLWQFDARNGSFALNREQVSLENEPLPAKIVGKDWTTLFQRRLNVAWLPPEKVFLRVAQFPLSEFSETLAMVELQLEKLSPMPVAQIVWNIHVLPHATGNMQTVIVMIVSRNAVEEFLGQLEGQGYLADRLELPLIDQLQATAVTGDGAWIYPEASGGKDTALSAWWYGGTLQNLDLINLPASSRAESLKEQLTQMAWAGELEGWLTAPPRWHLVAAPTQAAEWEPPLRTGLEQPIQIVEPRPTPQLAAATAQRAAHADSRANLLPEEFTTRYHQQFVDRLWMRGLFAVAGIYVIGVLIYMVALQYMLYRTRGVESQVAANSTEYTNTIQLKDKYQVLKDRQDLKFAALDCWQTIAELMPEGLKLDSLIFSEGKRLALSGTAEAGQAQEALEFHVSVRRATRNGQPVFDLRDDDDWITRPVQGGGIGWSFSLTLRRVEAQ